MKKEYKDACPKFPYVAKLVGPDGNGLGATEAMSLRDYFVGQLVQGLALNCGDGCTGYMEGRAKVAYQFADAILAERTKGTL